MAIYAHEGLPRSGKSYESAVYIILVALKKGRKVWAYVEGLNHQKFAELADISLHKCKELLIQLDYDDVIKIPTMSAEQEWKDGWIIIDEIQDFYPSGTRKLDQTVSKFVTQHGHDGLDILIMGQSMSDVHTLWRNRITQKTQFLKRDAIGKENSYLWTSFKGKLDGNGKIRFEKIRSGSKNYDKKYFGLYASHNAGTENTENHQDDRANIFKGFGFKIGIPAFALILCFALYYIYGFFTDSGMLANHQTIQKTRAQQNKLKSASEFDKQKQIAIQQKEKKPVPHKPVAPEKEIYIPIDYADKLANEYKPRLTGFIFSEKTKKIVGRIEFLDSSYRVHERLTFKQLRSMGWTIELTENYIHFKKQDKDYVITAWPVEPFGSIAESKRNALGSGNYFADSGNKTKIINKRRMAVLKHPDKSKDFRL